MDSATPKQLSRLVDELMELCTWLNERRDLETSSRLIPLVDERTLILSDAGKNNLQ
jgi:hypothetical protein